MYEALLDPSTGLPFTYDTWTDLRTAINNTAILPVTITPLMDRVYVQSILDAQELGSLITSNQVSFCVCTGAVDVLGCACVEDPISGTWLDVAACEAAQNCCTGSSVTTTTTCIPSCYYLMGCDSYPVNNVVVEMDPCLSPFLEDGKYYSLSGTSLGVSYSGCYQTLVHSCNQGGITGTIDINSVSNMFTSCTCCIDWPSGCI